MLCWKAGCSENCPSGLEGAGRKRTSARVQRAALPPYAVFGIKHAHDMRELKAVSQNLMHSSISITDGIYGNLNNNDMMETIAGLASNPEGSSNLRTLLQLMAKLQSNPDLLNQVLDRPGNA